MEVSASTTQNTPNGIYALKKAMEIEEQNVARTLQDSTQQQQRLQEQQVQQTRQQQQVAEATGLGVNLNVTA